MASSPIGWRNVGYADFGDASDTITGAHDTASNALSGLNKYFVAKEEKAKTDAVNNLKAQIYGAKNLNDYDGLASIIGSSQYGNNPEIQKLYREQEAVAQQRSGDDYLNQYASDRQARIAGNRPIFDKILKDNDYGKAITLNQDGNITYNAAHDPEGKLRAGFDEKLVGSGMQTLRSPRELKDEARKHAINNLRMSASQASEFAGKQAKLYKDFNSLDEDEQRVYDQNAAFETKKYDATIALEEDNWKRLQEANPIDPTLSVQALSAKRDDVMEFIGKRAPDGTFALGRVGGPEAMEMAGKAMDAGAPAYAVMSALQGSYDPNSNSWTTDANFDEDSFNAALLRAENTKAVTDTQRKVLAQGYKDYVGNKLKADATLTNSKGRLLREAKRDVGINVNTGYYKAARTRLDDAATKARVNQSAGVDTGTTNAVTNNSVNMDVKEPAINESTGRFTTPAVVYAQSTNGTWLTPVSIHKPDVLENMLRSADEGQYKTITTTKPAGVTFSTNTNTPATSTEYTGKGNRWVEAVHKVMANNPNLKENLKNYSVKDAVKQLKIDDAPKNVQQSILKDLGLSTISKESTDPAIESMSISDAVKDVFARGKAKVDEYAVSDTGKAQAAIGEALLDYGNSWNHRIGELSNWWSDAATQATSEESVFGRRTAEITKEKSKATLDKATNYVINAFSTNDPIPKAVEQQLGAISPAIDYILHWKGRMSPRAMLYNIQENTDLTEKDKQIAFDLLKQIKNNPENLREGL